MGGDDFQVLGIRAYKRQIKLFQNCKKDGLIDDLEVFDPKSRATLVVDGVPLRFWRKDDPDALVEERRMIFSKHAFQMSLFEPVDIVDRWAINYSVDSDGLMLAAELVGYCSTTNEAILSMPIPLVKEKTASLVGLTTELPKPESVQKSQQRVKPRVVGKDK